MKLIAEGVTAPRVGEGSPREGKSSEDGALGLGLRPRGQMREGPSGLRKPGL